MAIRSVLNLQCETHRLARSLLCALALCPIGGQCGAPFETEDPNTVPVGHVELLLFYQGTLGASGRSGSAPGLEVHLGVVDGLEIDVVPTVAFARPSGESTQHGYGDTTLGLKYRVIEESEAVPLVSIVPKLTIPTGDGDRSLGNGGSQVFLSAALQKTYGPFQTYGNAGYWINNGPGNRNYWFFGWQAQYQFSDTWILGTEVFHTTSQQVRHGPSTGFNVGGYYVLNPQSQLMFSGGRGLQNASETNRASAYAGLLLSF